MKINFNRNRFRFSYLTWFVSLRIAVFLLSFICLTKSNYAQQHSVRFVKLGIEDGLSQSSVYSIAQDKKGFLWFATQDGLNRYDGYNFNVFRADISNPNSITNSDLRYIFQDNQGKIWVGTWGGGLSCYDPVTNKFSRYKNSPSNANTLSNNFVYAALQTNNDLIWVGTDDGILNELNTKSGNITRHLIDKNSKYNEITALALDSKGNIWVGCKSGLFYFDVSQKKVTKTFQNNPADFNSLSNNFVTTIFVDIQGKTWIGTKKGLNLFNSKTLNFTHYFADKNKQSLNNDYITCLHQGNSKNFWIGTAEGLHKYIPETNSFHKFLNDVQNPFSLTNNSILSLFEDRFGILWIGTYGGGLNKYDSRAKQFVHYGKESSQNTGLSNTVIFALAQDKHQNIWVGSYGAGVSILNRTTNHYTNLQVIQGNNNAITSNLIRCIHLDKTGLAWIGTIGGGLNCYDTLHKVFTSYMIDPSNPKSISSNSIYSIFEDSNSDLWVGTLGGGVCKIDRKTKKITKYRTNPDNPNSLTHDDVFNISKDPDGKFWFCTRNGLTRYDPVTDSFKRYLSNPDDSTSLSHPKVYNVLFDSNGDMWVGTANGLNFLKKGSQKFKNYSGKDGLPNSIIYSILEDDRQNLWLGTNYGIVEFTPKTGLIKGYTKQDGLQSNEFNVNTCFKGQQGELFFGGVNGFNSFFPDSIGDNLFAPPIVISNFKIFNISVLPGDNSPLKQSIIDTKEIVLTHKDYSFMFEFAALHYSSPSKNQYAFMLENFDKKWNYTDSKMRVAVYTNLDPGTYIFKVKGSNCDGVWNEEGTSIKIIILPPFWSTWWFRTIIILITVGGIGWWYMERMMRLQAQKRKLESIVKQRTAEIEKQKEEIQLQSEVLASANRELEKLSIVASETDNAVLIMDAKGNFEWVNQAYSRMFGYTLDELISQISENIIGPKTPEYIRQKVKLCLTDKQTVHYEMLSITKAGAQKWVQITLTPIINEWGDIVKLVAIDSDISKLKEAEAEITLQKEEIQSQAENLEISNRQLEKLSIVARETDNAVIIMDAQSNFEWINEGFTRLYGYNLYTFIERFGINLIEASPNPNVKESVNFCIKEKKPVIYQSFVEKFNGEKIWVQTSLTPILDERGVIIKLIAIDSDINKLKEAEQEILTKSEILTQQRDELEIKKNQIEEKNKFIEGSIKYAQSIQTAMLSPIEITQKYFNSFVIYKPRDIVSGDFYWIANSYTDDGLTERITIAIVDCTGHGVPGAFMSMIGIRLLSEIVNEKKISEPKNILNHLNDNTVKALRQEQTNNTDGMDVCLCVFEFPGYKNPSSNQHTTLKFAGAKRPLYIARNDGTEIVLIKGTRKSIGSELVSDSNTVFEQVEIPVFAGDTVYMATDGLIDQNGPERKRLGTERFLMILNQVKKEPLNLQKQLILNQLLEYQQTEPQRDDITILAFQVK